MSDRMVFRLVAFGIVLAAAVVVLGAYTRLVDAGLGCPDWPGCYGFVGVPNSSEEIRTATERFPDAPVEAHKAWPEMVHRYFATSLGALCLVILGVAAWRRQRVGFALALAALVIVQGAFGAWTVTLKLWPQVVTAHLLGGFATLGLLWLYALVLAAKPLPETPRKLALAALVVVVVQVALGGWVTSNYAALACPDFPTCHGRLLPEMDFVNGFNIAQDVGPNYLGGQLSSDARVAIQVSHRLGAFIVLFVVGALAYRLRATPLGWTLGVVLALQLGLGIANVVFALPLVVAVLHNAGGAALLLAVITVNFAAYARPLPGPREMKGNEAVV